MSSLIYLISSTKSYHKMHPVLAAEDYIDSMGDEMFVLTLVYDISNSPLKKNKISGKEWFDIFKRI